MESNDIPEIPDRWETSDIPRLPSGGGGTLEMNVTIEQSESVANGSPEEIPRDFFHGAVYIHNFKIFINDLLHIYYSQIASFSYVLSIRALTKAVQIADRKLQVSWVRKFSCHKIA